MVCSMKGVNFTCNDVLIQIVLLFMHALAVLEGLADITSLYEMLMTEPLVVTNEQFA